MNRAGRRRGITGFASTIAGVSLALCSAPVSATVAQLAAQVAALQQPTTATPTPSDASHQDPEKMEPQPSAEHNPGKAAAFIGRKPLEVELDDHVTLVENMRGEIIRDWNIRDKKRHLAEDEMWDEMWTTMYEQPGDHRLVMRGLQGFTLLPGQYEKRAVPILEGKQEAQVKQFVRNVIARGDRRRIAFEEHVQRDKYWHITPIAAFYEYVETGIHRMDDWMYLLQGNPATLEQRAADLWHIVELLDKYENYHLGLFTGANSNHGIYKISFWELKDEHTLFLENLERGERLVKNTERTLTDWFRELYGHFWKTKGMITDRGEVRKIVIGCATEAERRAKELAIS